MKQQEQKEKFIVLRAGGHSYRAIAQELGICKSTAQKWAKDLEREIAEYKAEQLQALYDRYCMSKQARIQKLGETVARIDTALEQADLSTMHPDRLLYFKLQFTQALKEEYTPISTAPTVKGCTPADILQAFTNLYNRVQAGDISAEQANRESTILANILKAYDTEVLQQKLEALETMLVQRG